MLVAFCPAHGRNVLLSVSCIRHLVNLAPGVIAVELECYDGERLVVLTGTQTSRSGS